MVILRNSKINNPKLIKNCFDPFKNPNMIDGMIIGNDLDALLSSALLNDKFDWDIVGIYDYRTLWIDREIELFKKKIQTNKFIAVDLDINHPKIHSIGHHILSFSENDALYGHKLSLNPNMIRGIYHDQFTRKYPLSTIHFLTWIFQLTDDLDDLSRKLIWLSDSSFINGQKHRFKTNVSEWLENFFVDKIYLNDLKYLDTIEFENGIRNIVSMIKKTGIPVNKGQVSSYHLHLRGNQCQWSDPNSQRIPILRMYKLISEITSWNKPSLPDFQPIVGKRKTDHITKDLKCGLDNFLTEKKVFSYVFPNYRNINYTTNIF